MDLQAHSSSAACVVLNNVVKLRGGALGEQVMSHLSVVTAIYLIVIIIAICSVQNSYVRNEDLESHLVVYLNLQTVLFPRDIIRCCLYSLDSLYMWLFRYRLGKHFIISLLLWMINSC